jgi:hypothetical protein
MLVDYGIAKLILVRIIDYMRVLVEIFKLDGIIRNQLDHANSRVTLWNI